MKAASQHLPVTQRLLALVLATCVSVLSMAAVSPDLHARLHAEDSCCDHQNQSPQSHSDENSHTCGVTFLESGSIGVAFCATPTCSETLADTLRPARSFLRYSGKLSPKDARAPPVVVFV